jgi:hypothetical protein
MVLRRFEAELLEVFEVFDFSSVWVLALVLALPLLIMRGAIDLRVRPLGLLGLLAFSKPVLEDGAMVVRRLVETPPSVVRRRFTMVCVIVGYV